MQPARRPKTSPHTIWRVEVVDKQPRQIAVDRSIIHRSEAAPDGITTTLKRSRLFYLRGRLERQEVSEICRRLLCDAIVEEFSATECGGPASPDRAPSDGPAIEIMPKSGVMDPVALSAEQAIRDLGYDVDEVRTGLRYTCTCACSREELQRIAEGMLANTLIEHIYCSGFGGPDLPPDPFVRPEAPQMQVRTVPMCGADGETLSKLSREGHLFLNVEEMRAIQAYFRKAGREPTDVELETLAQTWSEHCMHKTLKSEIHYRGAGFPDELRIASYDLREAGTIERQYANLLKSTIVSATEKLNKPWCLSVFEDNAGIIEFDEHRGVAFKVETHNHPSALEPYGGAATGIGGCIRDIMGCGLGAKPIANTNVFCLAEPDLPSDRIPAGVIHPARTMREMVRGVRDYGNRMGIPTVNGAIAFDNRYLGNPLVYCGCVGVIPKDRIHKSPRSGDRIVLVGGRTGRDGIHGATFSSGSMTDTHADEFAHAVQIGNAITEKKMLDVLLQARDHARGCLYTCVTDCGAGGLSSAVGEMAHELGAVVELAKVPLKYSGLRYDEIWISEAQERMVLAVPPQNVCALLELFAAEDVEATDLGRFGDDGKLLLKYDGTVVGELDMQFLHNGLPKTAREATWEAPEPRASARADSHSDLRAELLNRLSDPNIASKEWVIRQYDHEVQGGSVIKPLMGPGRGPSDGAVVRPVLGSQKAVVLSCGLCPQLSDVDPYLMAIAAVDEAVRNNLCVGGDLDRMAILDNFCWGGVQEPHQLGALVRAAQGCHDAALAYRVPFISGKDSLNNVFEMRAADAERMNWPARLSIPGTLLISAISVISDFQRCRSSDLKEVGNKVLLVGPTGRRIDDLASAARAVCRMLSEFEAICSCHDIGVGGWLVAAAEMALGGLRGLQLVAPDDDPFAERLGCYLLEVAPAAVNELRSYDTIRVAHIGEVTASSGVQLDFHGEPLEWKLDELSRAWRGTFDWE